MGRVLRIPRRGELGFALKLPPDWEIVARHGRGGFLHVLNAEMLLSKSKV